MSNSLKQLSILTVPVADTADYNAIKPYKFAEATTNPIIIRQTASLPQYKHHVDKSVEYGVKTGKTLEEMIENAVDMVNVSFGEEILKVVTDKVHIQIDPRLAFNTEKSVSRALKLIRMFKDKGIDKKKVVIKLPSTFEGIQAASILERNHKVSCNMTTMFNLPQAAACAEAGVSYLAPFVGRIALWYEAKRGKGNFDSGHQGVEMLQLIQAYMRKFNYKTKVMGAYFVDIGEVKAVAGCDTVTLPTKLVEELCIEDERIQDRMDNNISTILKNKLILAEDDFRWLMNEDQMATDLLSEMVRVFTTEFVKLEEVVKELVLSIKK